MKHFDSITNRWEIDQDTITISRPDTCWVCGFPTHRVSIVWEYPIHLHCEEIASGGVEAANRRQFGEEE